jgi:glycosyltransferase involved in cell wall biosynthesis
MVVIVNSQLRDHGGHLFHNTLALCRGLEQFGVKWLVIGNMDAKSECFSLTHFLPYFPRFVYEGLDGVGPGKVLPFLRRAVQCKALLLDLFGRQLQLAKGDLVLVHSPREFEFLGWTLFLRDHIELFCGKDVQVVLFTLTDYQQPPILRSIFLREIFRFCLRTLRSLPVRVRVGTASALLKLELEKIGRLEIELFPDLAVGITELPEVPPDDVVDVVYLGGARYTKGFDLLVDAIEYLRTDASFFRKTRFWIQSNVERGMREELVRRALAKLLRLAAECDAVQIVQGPLPTEEYYRLVAQSDVIVLPYRSQFYRRLVSGPFVEALIFGRVPVIPQGTWMAREASKYGLEGLAFRPNSVTSLCQVLARVIANLDVFRKKVKEASAFWRQYHNAENFVRCLLPSASQLSRKKAEGEG